MTHLLLPFARSERAFSHADEQFKLLCSLYQRLVALPLGLPAIYQSWDLRCQCLIDLTTFPFWMPSCTHWTISNLTRKSNAVPIPIVKDPLGQPRVFMAQRLWSAYTTVPSAFGSAWFAASSTSVLANFLVPDYTSYGRHTIISPVTWLHPYSCLTAYLESQRDHLSTV